MMPDNDDANSKDVEVVEIGIAEALTILDRLVQYSLQLADTIGAKKNYPLIGGVRLLESFSTSVSISTIKHFFISIRYKHCLSNKISRSTNIKNNNNNEISNKIFLYVKKSLIGRCFLFVQLKFKL